MRDSFADYYRTGEQVRRGPGWELYRGVGAQAESVWLLRIDGAADQTPAIRRRADWLRSQDWSLAAPHALAPDGRDLVTITNAGDMSPIAVRATWSVPEALRCTASSCAVLQAMHDVELVHGHLDAWLVDVAPDGAASLRGFAELAVVGTVADRREDGRALGRVLRHAFVGLDLPDQLAGALAGLARGDRSLTEVAGLARAALAGESELTLGSTEITLGSADERERDLIASLRAGSDLVQPTRGRRTRHSPAPRRHARHAAGAGRDWSSRLLVPGAVLALLALVIVVWTTDRGGRDDSTASTASTANAAAASSASTAPTVDAELTDRLHELYAARSAAISAGQRAQLAAVYAPGAAMLAQDEALIGQLAAEGSQLDGFEIELVSIEQIESQAGTATAQVTDRIPPFEIVALDGTRTAVAGRQSARTELALVLGADGWVIASAVRV